MAQKSGKTNKHLEEKTVVLIKPDAVKRGLIGEIISRIERRGLKIIALQMIAPSRKEIDRHYPKDNVWIKRLGEKAIETCKKYGLEPKKEFGCDNPVTLGKETRNALLNFMTSGPIVKIIIQGVHSIDMVRKLVGHSIPARAEMGTIRGDYSTDSAVLANSEKRAVHNLVHASENAAEVKNELKLWFKPEEIHPYTRSEEEVMF